MFIFLVAVTFFALRICSIPTQYTTSFFLLFSCFWPFQVISSKISFLKNPGIDYTGSMRRSVWGQCDTLKV